MSLDPAILDALRPDYAGDRQAAIQAVIAANFPAITELRTSAPPLIAAIEDRLGAEDASGGDTSYLRQAIRKLRWRLEYTGDAVAARAALARVERLAALPVLPGGLAQNDDGSYGAETDTWFLKLDQSVDHLLAPGAAPGARPPRFLDRINEPARLQAYVDSLLVSHPAEDGVDRRKELNFATAGLVRLILWRRPAGYPWDPRLEAVVRRFIAAWQDPKTGFFGAAYEIEGHRFRTADLSLTFHMARYLKGEIGYWPQLIETLLAMRDRRYPNGWLDEEGMTAHNNYDVATLFQLGWPRMSPDQRRRAGAELARLTAWCLTAAIAPDGRVAARAVGESLSEAYYFTIAFLDTVGCFDPARRFWTDRVFVGAPALRERLRSHLLTLDPGDPMTRMAIERLGPRSET